MQYGEWKQTSGDRTASEYGATFAQVEYKCDDTDDTVYGVRVVEVTNMVEACGDDWDMVKEDGVYLVSESWVDVDGMEVPEIRRILECMGMPRTSDTPHYPRSVLRDVARMTRGVRELTKLSVFTGTPLSDAQSKTLAQYRADLDTLAQWYAIPAPMRATLAHDYGGYSSDQNYYTWTLKAAMDMCGIPAGALWHAAEYDAPCTDTYCAI